jgi:hypothetical protein
MVVYGRNRGFERICTDTKTAKSKWELDQSKAKNVVPVVLIVATYCIFFSWSCKAIVSRRCAVVSSLGTDQQPRMEVLESPYFGSRDSGVLGSRYLLIRSCTE